LDNNNNNNNNVVLALQWRRGSDVMVESELYQTTKNLSLKALSQKLLEIRTSWLQLLFYQTIKLKILSYWRGQIHRMRLAHVINQKNMVE